MNMWKREMKAYYDIVQEYIEKAKENTVKNTTQGITITNGTITGGFFGLDTSRFGSIQGITTTGGVLYSDRRNFNLSPSSGLKTSSNIIDKLRQETKEFINKGANHV